MRLARFLPLALAAALAACAGRRVPEAALAPAEPVEPPVLQVDAFAPSGADAFGVTLAIQGRVTNPNPFEVDK